MNLELRGVDFKGTNFMDDQNCAISKAYRRQLRLPFDDKVSEGLDDIVHTSKENTVFYEHSEYRARDFDIDLEIARRNDYREDTVIRTIELKEIWFINNPTPEQF